MITSNDTRNHKIAKEPEVRIKPPLLLSRVGELVLRDFLTSIDIYKLPKEIKDVVIPFTLGMRAKGFNPRTSDLNTLYKCEDPGDAPFACIDSFTESRNSYTISISSSLAVEPWGGSVKIKFTYSGLGFSIKEAQLIRTSKPFES